TKVVPTRSGSTAGQITHRCTSALGLMPPATRYLDRAVRIAMRLVGPMRAQRALSHRGDVLRCFLGSAAMQLGRAGRSFPRKIATTVAKLMPVGGPAWRCGSSFRGQ